MTASHSVSLLVQANDILGLSRFFSPQYTIINISSICLKYMHIGHSHIKRYIIALHFQQSIGIVSYALKCSKIFYKIFVCLENTYITLYKSNKQDPGIPCGEELHADYLDISCSALAM